MGSATRSIEDLVLRWRRQYNPPRKRIISTKRPNAMPTASGTLLVLLVDAAGCEPVAGAVKPVVDVVDALDSSVDASPSRRTLHDQKGA
jgi:hypothetical protein